MPRDGSGVYSLPAGTTASPNTTIESAKYNAFGADLVVDANAARPITAGGTGAATATDALNNLGGARLSWLNFPDSGGSANALTLTLSPALTAYASQAVVTFRATETNTAAATLNVSGLGAKAIRKMVNGADAALAAGDIQDNGRYTTVYDATANAAAGAFILLDPSISIGTFTPTIDGTSTAGVGTYTTQIGRYTKVDRMIFFEINLTWTAHTGTGNIIISNLPFTSSGAGFGAPCAILASNLSYTGDYLIGNVPNNSTQIQIRTVAAGAALGDVAIDTLATINISGHYMV
jgi:hypothetical protein